MMLLTFQMPMCNRHSHLDCSTNIIASEYFVWHYCLDDISSAQTICCCWLCCLCLLYLVMIDPYDIQYENIPHFCFSCGRLGHSNLLCPTPRTRDKNGDMPFGKELRPPDERKRYASSESSTKAQQSKSSKMIRRTLVRKQGCRGDLANETKFGT